MNGMAEELSKLRMKGWWMTAIDTGSRKKFLKEADAQQGCSAKGDETNALSVIY